MSRSEGVKNAPLPATFRHDIVPVHPAESVRRVIHTRVGDGPRVLEHGLFDLGRQDAGQGVGLDGARRDGGGQLVGGTPPADRQPGKRGAGPLKAVPHPLRLQQKTPRARHGRAAAQEPPRLPP